MYTALWALVGLGLVFALFIRPDIEMSVAPVRNPIFVTLSDGSIRNTYDVRLLNKHGDDRPFRVTVTGDADLQVQLEGVSSDTVNAPADTSYLQKVYVIAPAGTDAANSERTPFRIWVEDTTNGELAHKDTIFNGRDN